MSVRVCYLLLLILPAFGLERFVAFRDGTVLRLDLPEASFVWNGSERMPLSGCERISFSHTVGPVSESLKLVDALGADRATERNAAEAALLKSQAPMRSLLLYQAAHSPDPERRLRCRRVAQQLAISSDQQAFDAVRLQSGESRFGSLGQWRIQIDGHLLTRKEVRRIWDPAVQWDWQALGYTQGDISRMSYDEAVEKKSLLRWIGFDKAPDGTAIVADAPLNDLFVPWGCSLSTSVTNSIVAADSYTVQGRSRGLSASTLSPRWQGSITVRFHQPGRPDLPAGVHHVGCWVAAVVRDGTRLEAYDRLGRKIGEVVVKDGPNAFLGMQSPVPIASVRIVPNPEIDGNYTMDDLVFSAPRMLHVGVKNLRDWRLETRGGECLYASKLELDGQGVRLEDLACGWPDRAIPLARVRQIVAPGAFAPLPQPGLTHTTLLLKGGEQLALRPDTQLKSLGADGLQLLRGERRELLPLQALDALMLPD